MAIRTTENWIEWIERQLGASLQMLDVAIDHATEEMWADNSDTPPFWRVCAHTIFYIDFYFSTFDPEMVDIPETYQHPAFLLKYGKTKLDDIENAIVTKDEMHQFLRYSRKKLRQYFDQNIEDQLSDPSGFSWLKMTKGELLLYNMRHIMEHTAILNQILKKHGLPVSGWRGIDTI